MPGRLRLMKSINKLGHNNKSAIRLSIPAKPQKLHEPTKDAFHCGLTDQLDVDAQWQIKWMEQFAKSREDCSAKLQNQQLQSKKQADKITELLEKTAKQHEMLARVSNCLNKKNDRINKYKSRWIEAEKKLKSMKKKHVDVSINTDTSCFHCADASTNTDSFCSQNSNFDATEPVSSHSTITDNLPTQISTGCEYNEPFSIETPSSNTDSVNELNQQFTVARAKLPHTKKRLSKHKTAYEPRYKCRDCPYTTNKSDTFKVHCEEFCVNAPTKDRECKYCGKSKWFTRRGLRTHVNNYVTNKHKPGGKHKNVSLDEHLEYLAEIKAEKQ